jgi:hypothetical protein
MAHKPCRDRTFPLWLSYEYERQYTANLTWLQQFLIRLGRLHALALWEGAFQRPDDGLLDRILASGWQETGEDRRDDLEAGLDSALAERFPAAIDSFGPTEARDLLDCTPPFRQIRQAFSSLDLVRETTTYEWLHLFLHGFALLVEEAIRRHGKEGELVAYDALLEEVAAATFSADVQTYMERRRDRFQTEPEEATPFTAGLEVELVRASETEVVNRVVECEWARYYRERHPTVGYLMACSVDNAAYRSANERIRLQRTTNLMEGGDHCDFRVYALPEVFGKQP